MNWRKLFNFTAQAPAKTVPGQPYAISAAASVSQGVFITPQSIMTFPVATFAIGLLAGVINALIPSLKGNLWIPFGISLAIGGLIYWAGVSGSNAPQSPKDKVIAAVVALINACYLFASCTGVLGDISQLKPPTG